MASFTRAVKDAVWGGLARLERLEGFMRDRGYELAASLCVIQILMPADRGR